MPELQTNVFFNHLRYTVISNPKSWYVVRAQVCNGLLLEGVDSKTIAANARIGHHEVLKLIAFSKLSDHLQKLIDREGLNLYVALVYLRKISSLDERNRVATHIVQEKYNIIDAIDYINNIVSPAIPEKAPTLGKQLVLTSDSAAPLLEKSAPSAAISLRATKRQRTSEKYKDYIVGDPSEDRSWVEEIQRTDSRTTRTELARSASSGRFR